MKKNYVLFSNKWCGKVLAIAAFLAFTGAHATTIAGVASPLSILQAAPGVTAFSPAAGCASGTEITITGTGFTAATAVTVGGVSATSFSVNSDSEITAITAAGTVTGVIAVTTPNGTASSATSFTVNAAPDAVSLNQEDMTICQSTIVTLSATGGATAGETANSIVLTEGFEGGTAAGWTIENTSGSTAGDWAYRTSSHTGSRTPRTGTHLASFDGRAFAAFSGKLITPVMDLSAFTTEAKIDFWYQQPTWGGDQNVLKVYYRAAAGDAWTMIWSDLTSKTTWTAASVILPSVSTTYQIAFEGTSAYGYSIVLDDVEVTGQGPAQPQYVWSPVAGLYTDAAATVAYTGQALATVYAAPATSTVYSVSSSNASGCTSGTSVDITVTTVDMPEGAAIQTFTDGETVADLDVSGTDLTWYSDADATNVIPSTTVLVEGTSYYVTQTVDDCESNPLTITAQNDLSASGFVRENLQAFPNPVTDVLNLKFVDAIQRIVVTNLLGQTIRTQSVGDIEARINFSGLESGTYHVTVTTVSGSHTLKIVKR